MLHKTSCNFKKIPGKVYYVYKQRKHPDQEMISMISPEVPTVQFHNPGKKMGSAAICHRYSDMKWTYYNIIQIIHEIRRFILKHLISIYDIFSLINKTLLLLLLFCYFCGFMNQSKCLCLLSIIINCQKLLFGSCPPPPCTVYTDLFKIYDIYVHI